MEIKEKKLSTSKLLTFLIPSLLGILLFMTPIKYNGEITIPIAILSKGVLNYFIDHIPLVAVFIILISAITSIITKIFKPKFIMNNAYLKNVFDVTTLWFVLRILGAILVVSVYFKIGPSFIWEENTGGLLLYSLLPILFSVFLFAGFLLPLVLDFGLLEFTGSLLSKIMRPIFKLPGRSSIDCITSWLGDGSIGVLLTSKQYEEGFYSKREAAVIGTNFSAVSITFCLVVISQVNLSHMFIPFYLTITLSGIIAAIIIPRIRPLSKISDTYYNNKKCAMNEDIPKGYTPFSWGLDQAVKRASKSTDISKFIKNGIKNVIDMWIGVIPIVMAMGTITLIVAEHTQVFQILGAPFIPLLNLLGIPEAYAASQTMIIGFADMFLPSVLASTIQSEMTRFIIACVSVTQLIYMSEVGGMLLGSKIPVKFKDLFIIFLERTLITLPIVTLIAHILF